MHYNRACHHSCHRLYLKWIIADGRSCDGSCTVVIIMQQSMLCLILQCAVAFSRLTYCCNNKHLDFCAISYGASHTVGAILRIEAELLQTGQERTSHHLVLSLASCQRQGALLRSCKTLCMSSAKYVEQKPADSLLHKRLLTTPVALSSMVGEIEPSSQSREDAVTSFLQGLHREVGFSLTLLLRWQL